MKKMETKMDNNEAMIQPVARRRGQKGVTTVEYALMLALVALAVAVATPGLKNAVVTIFNDMSSSLTAAT
jgi:Flp pilus assembly pilin Flp